MNTTILQKVRNYMLPSLIGKGVGVGLLFSGLAFTSCEDFFEQESDHVIYADTDHLDNAVDTIYSVTGIMDKLQLLADRTILFGEVRGDLVDLTTYAPADVRQIANFDVDDDNIYNSPRDYYAVINNCNYFIERVHKDLKNNRNEYVFMREYAAVKAFRAWTYLQLALNYGEVRYVTTPILTKQDADNEEKFPLLGIQALCDELINDLQPLVPTYAAEYPSYGAIGGVNTRLCYFPLYVLLGELNLWAGHYREAALAYYRYIATRNGQNSAYPTGTVSVSWATSDNSVPASWTRGSTYGYMTALESYTDNSELITMIPISAEYDSVANTHYNQLRVLYNSREDNDFHASIVPSEQLQNISAAQWNCLVVGTGALRDTIYAPRNLDNNLTGDLRLDDSWLRIDNVRGKNGELIDYQTITKFMTRNVHLWRRQMVYLHMAEALNRAGYPRFAYKILEEGVNNIIIGTDDGVKIVGDLLSYYTTPADTAFLKQFDFPRQNYTIDGYTTLYVNQQGMHSRGSGNTTANQYYRMPVFTTSDSIALQIDSLERMIITEGALEFAFEGLRYYDLMRVAMRRGDTKFLADRVYARRGESQKATVQGEIKKDLYDQNNWFLHWNGKIGLGK